jgi:SAM-dependent methyltransferase
VDDGRIARYRFAMYHVPGCRVVDIGCGDGQGSALLAAAGAEAVIGLEAPGPAFDALAARYALPNFTFKPVHGLTLPLGDREADVVVCLDLLDQIEEPDVLLREVQRVLFFGGTAIFSVPNSAGVMRGLFGRIYQQQSRHGMYELQFMSLLDLHFARVQLFGQVYQRSGDVDLAPPQAQDQRTRARFSPPPTHAPRSATVSAPQNQRAPTEGWVFIPRRAELAISLVAVCRSA